MWAPTLNTDGHDGRRRRGRAVAEPRVNVAEADRAVRFHGLPSRGVHSIGDVVHVELAARIGAESLVHGARVADTRIDLKFSEPQTSVVAW